MAGNTRPEPMDDATFAAMIHREINDAIGGGTTEVAVQRQRALNYYLGGPIGNEVEGRSQVVIQDAFEVVEWVLPSLLRIFCGNGKLAVRYTPDNQTDVEAAQQATEFVNQSFLRDCDGYIRLHNWMKDALIEKNGLVFLYWDERQQRKVTELRGVSDEELAYLAKQDGIEIHNQTSYEKPIPQMDPQSGQVVEVPQTFHDFTVVEVKSSWGPAVANVPPEDFFIARRSVDIKTSPFVCWRRRLTESDLVAMGMDPDLVQTLPSADGLELDPEKVIRFADDEAAPSLGTTRQGPERELWIYQGYIRADRNGDGMSELRCVMWAGVGPVEILEDYEVSDIDLYAITPIPMPHKFYGRSLVDVVLDLQEINSTVLRQQLDNLYLTNNSRVVVLEDQVEIDDLLTSRPGGIVRAQVAGAVEPLAVQPVGPMSMNMLEYLAGVKENRTGVTRYNQGTDAESLNHTATGVAKIMQASQIRIESIARIFAAQMKPFFRGYLRMMVRHADEVRGRMIRMRGKWVEIDPSKWSENLDLEIEVGVGIGSPDELIQQKQSLLAMAQALMQTPAAMLFKPKNLFNLVSDIAADMGYKDENRYFTDPGDAPFPPPPPDPKMAAIQAKSQTDQQRVALHGQKLQMDAQHKAGQLQIEAGAAQQDMALGQAAQQQEAALEVEKLRHELALERARFISELAMKREEMAQEMALAREEMLANVEIERERARRLPKGGNGQSH